MKFESIVSINRRPAQPATITIGEDEPDPSGPVTVELTDLSEVDLLNAEVYYLNARVRALTATNELQAKVIDELEAKWITLAPTLNAALVAVLNNPAEHWVRSGTRFDRQSVENAMQCGDFDDVAVYITTAVLLGEVPKPNCAQCGESDRCTYCDEHSRHDCEMRRHYDGTGEGE